MFPSYFKMLIIYIHKKYIICNYLNYYEEIQMLIKKWVKDYVSFHSDKKNWEKIWRWPFPKKAVLNKVLGRKAKV